MRPQHYVMTPEMVYRYAANLLQTQLQWVDHGRKCTVKTLLLVLFYAAGQVYSLSLACQRLRTAPSDQAVRDALRALCPPLEILEQQLNNSFAAQLPKGLRQRRQRVAIDLTLIPYHGQPHRRVEEIYRGQAKSGTTHFHADTTAYIQCLGMGPLALLVYPAPWRAPAQSALPASCHLVDMACSSG